LIGTPYLQFRIVSPGTASEEINLIRSVKGFTKLDKIKSEGVPKELNMRSKNNKADY
jgi:hypothetical protein